MNRLSHFQQAVVSLTIRFAVRGLPATQGSKKIVWPKGRDFPEAYLVDANATSLKDWRSAVRTAAAFAWRGQPLEGPLAVRQVFYFLRPASQARLERLCPWRWRTPDAEKLARAVADALKGLIWRDDAQVALLGGATRYAAGAHLPGGEGAVRRLDNGGRTGVVSSRVEPA